MLRELWGLFRPMLRWALIGILIFMFWQALPMDMLGMVIAGDLGRKTGQGFYTYS